MPSVKQKILITLKSISWIGLVILFFWISLTGIQSKEDMRCQKIRVIIQKDKNLGFIHSKDIYREVNRAQPGWEGKKIKDIKVNLIENHVRQNDYVKKAEVYLDHEKNLNVFIQPKAPIARIHDVNHNYYLSESWDAMPPSQEFSSRVIQITGKTGPILNPKNSLDSMIQQEIKYVMYYLEKNEEWKTILDQIHICNNGKLEMYTSFSNVKLKIGYGDHQFEKRMQKVKHFFETAIYIKDINSYESLDFQFSQQVIAQKK